MQKTLSIIFVIILFVGIGFLLTRESTPATSSSSTPVATNQTTANQPSGQPITTASNVSVTDGVQYVTILAKGGYLPRLSQAQSGIPTKLIVKTNGTYDCSSSLIIRDAKFQQILPQTGETEIDLGTPKPGQTTQGVCGMGMYNFQIAFK
jgi:hypothetical protein